MSGRLRLLLSVLLVAALPSLAGAQDVRLRGFAGVDVTRFAATQSFETMFGSDRGTGVNGGGEVLFKQLFARVEASRIRKQGERLFIANDRIFHLGITDTVTIMPVLVTGGYRFGKGPFVPYAGAGVGWHRYQESDKFSDASESVNEIFIGYHVTGGAEYAIARWLAVAGEAQWSTVKDALGQNANSVSAHFGETDLGGTTLRVKVVVGR